MVTFKKSILQIFLIHFIFAYVFIFTVNGFADSAKQKYMEADACYKKLRHSASKQKKENEWLNCISRYEIIYRLHPKDSWAPAGMYKAAKLYTTLSKLSGKQSHESQAADLLASLQNNYPKSVYAGRAKSMLKTITDNPNFSVKKIRHIRSKKSLSKNNVLIKKFVQSNEVTVKKKNKPCPLTARLPI